MIVESFGNNMKSLSSHLASSALPLEILTATDGEMAIARLQREPADLVIIDTLLRGKMDGFDLCRALRSSTSNQHLPIILLLAGYLSLERSKGISAGADLLLHRPVVKEELLKMIELLVGLRFEQAVNSPVPVPERYPVRKLRPVSL
jgi:DNA-binding response OmpR family regulator